MSNFQEYPKVMKHPQHVPAITYRQPRYKPGEEGWGKPIDPGHSGRPERFPDVMVNNLDQEQDYAAKGYVPAGASNPEAYRRAHTGNSEQGRGGFQEYPKMLYRETKKGELENKVVNSTSEEKALGSGWYPTPDAARGVNGSTPYEDEDEEEQEDETYDNEVDDSVEEEVDEDEDDEEAPVAIKKVVRKEPPKKIQRISKAPPTLSEEQVRARKAAKRRERAKARRAG